MGVAVEIIVTIACIIGFGLFVLLGFLCLKKRLRLKWEHFCDYICTCGEKYPSEKTEDLRQQEARQANNYHRNKASVLNKQPSYGRKRPEEIEPLASAVTSQRPSYQVENEELDVEAGRFEDDAEPIVQYSGEVTENPTLYSPDETRHEQYYSSSTHRSYTSRPYTGRSDREGWCLT